MNWIEGIAWGLLATVIGLIVHRVIHARRSGITPLGVLYAVWISATSLYVANPFTLYRLPTRGTFALAASAASFTFAYGVVIVTARSKKSQQQRTPTATANQTEQQLSVFRNAWIVCVLAWLVLFLIYLTEIRAFTGSGLHVLLYSLRIALSSSTAPPTGFYYFYFAQILVPFGAVLRIRTGKRVYLIWSLAATLSLVLTSGRTNLIIAIASWASVNLLAGGHKFNRQRVVTILFTFICVLGAFSFLGNTIGKTYQNSELYPAFGDSPPVPASLVQPIFYLAGPIPYFGQLTLGTGGTDRGSNLARPLLQLGSVVVPALTPPPKIQPFVGVPFQTNLGTYLSPIWRDFGFVGIVLINALLGPLAAFSWVAWRNRRTPAALVVASVVLVFCASSILDASFTELWFLLFLAVVAVAAKSSRPRTGSRILDDRHLRRQPELQIGKGT